MFNMAFLLVDATETRAAQQRVSCLFEGVKYGS